MSLSIHRCGIWLGIALALAGFGAANWHLVHVAMSSQPDCVAHLRSGDGEAAHGLYSAATSSCTPSTSRLETK
jgi:hypothetical protein